MEFAEPESDEAAQDERVHNQYTFGFWWKGREEELNAVYEKAVELNEKAFFASLMSFEAYLMIQLRMAVTDETALSRRHPKRSLDCILKARTDQPDYNVWNFLDVDENSEYDVREPEAMLLKNFRKTRAFAWMIVGVEYHSTDASEIETISPTLRDFRKRTTDHVGDILYANQFPRIPTGETAATTEDESGASHVPETPDSKPPTPKKKHALDSEPEETTRSTLKKTRFN